jgi:hypothetical protein
MPKAIDSPKESSANFSYSEIVAGDRKASKCFSVVI